MANIRKRGNTYQIRVSEGYDSKGKQVVRTKTWKPDEGAMSASRTTLPRGRSKRNYRNRR